MGVRAIMAPKLLGCETARLRDLLVAGPFDAKAGLTKTRGAEAYAVSKR